jgi:superfamily II DNA helicase RecQ
MLYRVIDLRYSKVKGEIDDEPLQRLLHGHEVVGRTERLYHHEGEPHLLVSVLYRLAALPRFERPGRAGDEGRQVDGNPGGRTDGDWRSILREEDAHVFEKLRAWRSARARAEAVPPYVILSNVQLATIARNRPRSLSALEEVPGVGKSRLDRFGKEILEVLADGIVPSGVPGKEDCKGEGAP